MTYTELRNIIEVDKRSLWMLPILDRLMAARNFSTEDRYDSTH